MATHVLTDAVVDINAVDHSDHCHQVTVNYESEVVDDTTFGPSGTRSNAPGLKMATIDVDFYADEAASKVNVLLFADVGVARTVLVRPTSAAVSATNPNYTLTAFSTTMTPLSGAVGAMNAVRMRYVAASQSALSRATS